ncbi:MAG: hypothetical protein ACRD3T_15830 [Terriglobia bacterium]
MTKKSMAIMGSRNRLRSLAIIGLVLAQTQLVMVAGLHHHASDFLPAPRQVPFCSQSHNPAGPVPDHTPCVVCQIVRQSAARPALSSKLVQLPRGVIFHPTSSLHLAPVLRIATLPVRAPPFC